MNIEDKMLLKDFYKVESLSQMGEDKYVAEISLNNKHEVFRGHFPGNPVTPGVCMMQIVKEVTERILNKKLQMVKATNVKFMALINPDINPNLRLEIDLSVFEESKHKVKNTTYFGETVALKLVSIYQDK